ELTDVAHTARPEPVADTSHEPFRRGGAGGHADDVGAGDPALVDLRRVVDEVSVLSRRASDLDEPHRVGRVAGADDEQHVDLVEQLLHRALPVRRRITDVLTRWPLDL